MFPPVQSQGCIPSEVSWHLGPLSKLIPGWSSQIAVWYAGCIPLLVTPSIWSEPWPSVLGMSALISPLEVFLKKVFIFLSLRAAEVFSKLFSIRDFFFGFVEILDLTSVSTDCGFLSSVLRATYLPEMTL